MKSYQNWRLKFVKAMVPWYAGVALVGGSYSRHEGSRHCAACGQAGDGGVFLVPKTGEIRKSRNWDLNGDVYFFFNHEIPENCHRLPHVLLRSMGVAHLWTTMMNFASGAALG